MNLRLDCDFKKNFAKDRFFFGVANAPYLCEGGFNVPGGPYNNYGYYEEDGRVPRSGDTTRFWHNYSSHVNLAAALGMDVFRMGLDWSRIQPSHGLGVGDAPEWDTDALARYAEIVGAVLASGMEPIITLHHFTHPAWLGEQMWLNDEAVELLVDYELRVVEEINERLAAMGHSAMRHFITFNELNLLPIIYHLGKLRDRSQDDRNAALVGPVYDNVLSSHVRIYDGLYALFERKGWGVPQVGFGTASNIQYEFDKLLLDIVRLRSQGVERGNIGEVLGESRRKWVSAMDSLARAKLTDEQYRAHLSQVQSSSEMVQVPMLEKTIASIYESSRDSKLDYISVNVYEPLGGAKSLGVRAAAPRWWEFGTDPDVFYTFIHAYNEGNNGLPLFMGENSVAYRQPIGGKAERRPDSWDRDRFLRSRLMAVVRCIIEGVPVRGFIYWSLVDDFEWEAGFEPRLGLYNYDYERHAILDRDAVGDDAGLTYARLASALRSGEKNEIQRVFTNVGL